MPFGFEKRSKVLLSGVLAVVLAVPPSPAQASLVDDLKKFRKEVERVERTVDEVRDIVGTVEDITGTMKRTKRDADDISADLDYLFGGSRTDIANKAGMFRSYRDTLRNFRFDNQYQQEMLNLAKAHFDHLLFAARATYDGYGDINPFDQGRDRGDSNANVAMAGMAVARMDVLTYAAIKEQSRNPEAKERARQREMESKRIENQLTTDLFSLFGKDFKDLPASRKLTVRGQDLGTRYCGTTPFAPYVELFFEDAEKALLNSRAKIPANGPAAAFNCRQRRRQA